MSKSKIKSATIKRSNITLNTRVWVKMNDGAKFLLFDFDSNEMNFTAGELIGKTTDEAIKLKEEKYERYLSDKNG